MIKNYFVITLRSMMKHKLFIIINVFGMGVSIACCIVAYLATRYDMTFDGIHKNRENIYRVSSVREFENKITRFGYVPLPLGEVVDKTFHDTDRFSRYLYSYSNFKRDHDVFPANLSYVDPGFFEMFSFEFISGMPSDLKDKTSVFISEAMSVRLFRTPQEAFGKTITQAYGTEVRQVKIAGVFRDPPMNSSFYRKDGSAYMNFENFSDEHIKVRRDDWRWESTLFIQIPDAGRVSSVLAQLQPYKENNNSVREDFQIVRFELDPLVTMAHDDRSENTRSWTWGAPPISAIIGSAVMGLLILLISCFNLTNTAIAISSGRLKEIGVRKVMGSQRTHLIIQFIGETTFICFIALLVGIGLAHFLISGWNSMWAYMRLPTHYLDNAPFILFLVSVLLFTGILAGSYPAFYVSSFEPVTIMKGKLRFGGTNYLTRVLLALQFSVSLIAIVSAIGFLQNARYQRDYDLGFDIRGSVIAWMNNESEYDTYRDALQSNPQILHIAGANSGIFSNRAHEPVKHESKQAEVDIIQVGDNYLRTMDLKLLQGRDFMKDSETDQRESIIVTEGMTRLFGWQNPLGKEVVWKDTVRLFVVGVVKDVYTMGLWREMQPMMIRYILPDKYNQIVVATKSENLTAVDNFMKARWNERFPNRLYNGRMLSLDIQEVNAVNLNIMYMYIFLGVIAMILSATGLFTLVSLNIIRRMKEIGVRKVLGASVFNITRIVNTEFLIILVVGAVLGSWAGLTMSNLIMGSIWKYFQGVNILTVIISIGLLFVVSILTVGFKVYRIATMNPVRTLKDE